MSEDELIKIIDDLSGWGTSYDKLVIRGVVVEAVHELYVALDTRNTEIAGLRKALESLRVKNHFVNEDDCWYSCPMSDSYCGEDRRDVCNCGMHRTNAIINKALKGAAK